ncbi:DUF2252 domain-containing protein [Collinsella tanakaei]|uniref:DUF2252 domain-containing protein n=1 Tax=Collinsella tanakaei TaxID=626935 RepID=UPI00195D7789|nr:DUF2252 domain-containing protein [Collinsella tanakaei]MBM6778673.1 DUF2252 domain-containing protein [Collinsella tanakaei]
MPKDTQGKHLSTPDRRHRGDVDARRQRGKQAREACPRSSHGIWEVHEGREDAIGLLVEQNATRVPDLIGLRHERMCVSPFTFYRGTAIIMARDLATTPTTGIEVQCVGDAHIGNFGIFASHTRHLVFDINDFDETAPGPWEWDIKRLIASVEICGRDRGFGKSDRKAAVRACAKAYRHAMARFAEMRELDIWHAHLDLESTVARFEDELSGKQSRTLRRAMEKAAAKDSVRAADKLAHIGEDGHLRFNVEPPALVPLSELGGFEGAGADELSQRIAELYARYLDNISYDVRCLVNRYTPVDIARKVVGVGSVGTRAWIALMEGRDVDDPLVLQMKEAQQSVIERFYGSAPFTSHGERVVQGQRLIQSTSDMLLGWTSIELPGTGTRDYYVRQLWNGKGSIDLEGIGTEGLASTSRLCAWSLAHAHARTGDGIAIAAYLGDGDAFDDALWDFAQAYADQNEADYDLFCTKIERGELA